MWAVLRMMTASIRKKNGRPGPAIHKSGPKPLASGYSIPESETGLKLPLTDMSDLHIVPFQPDVFEQGGREMQIADATFQPGDPFLNQGFDVAQQGEFDRHNILQLNERFSRREDITLRDNRG